MQAVAVFNNKGGVGKTTLLCNLAGYLALRKNKRILIVDADPQCNATQNLFQDEDVESIYESNQVTVDTIIKPLAQGKGYTGAVKPLRSHAFGLDVIPGDPKLALTEDLLSTDWVAAIGGNTRGLRTSFVFANLLEKFDEYDIVLFDMGPSLGSINRAVLLSADHFIMPMSIDIFSLRAMENIAASVNKWKDQLTSGLERNDEVEELEILDPRWKLSFAGYVTQQYTAKRDSDGNRRPVKAFDKIMAEIPESIENSFLKNQAPTISLDSSILGTIPTLHSLIPMSQNSRKPIFELKAADGVVGAHFQKVKEYEEIIAEIAGRFLSNLESLK